MPRPFPAFLFAVLILLSSASADIRYHLTDIGTFGGDWSQALGINNKGQVVGSAARPDGIRRPFLFSDGNLFDLGSSFGDNGRGLAAVINERGQAGGQTQVGVESWGPHYRAAYYENGTVEDIGDFGGWNSFTSGINARGYTVGTAQSKGAGGPYHAFLYDGKSLNDLTPNALSFAIAEDINDSGHIVGSYSVVTYTNTNRAFVLDESGMHELGTFGAIGSAALGINELGQIVGAIQYTSSSSAPFLYEKGVMRLIPFTATSGKAEGINNSGQIVGSTGMYGGQPPVAAFLYDGRNTTDLISVVESGAGLFLQSAHSINDLGEIASYGQINGQTHGFRLTPTQWKYDSDGLWSDPANWLPSTVPDSLTANANFLAMTTAPRTITLDSSHSMRTLNFRNKNSYTIVATNNAALTLGDINNPAQISVIEGNHTIAAPLTLAGSTILNITDTNSLTITGPFSIAANTPATKSGDGTIEISGPQSHSPGASLLITRGHLLLSSNAGSNLVLSIASNPDAAPARVRFHSDQDLAGLSIDFASPGLQTLDLFGHTLSIHAADLASAKSSLLAALRNAKTNPNDGLTDSTLSANATIALLEFPDQLLLQQALTGDLNIDGQVTIADFIQLAAHFDMSGPQLSWTDGDLNHDTAVTIADFIDLASNFGASYSGDVSGISPSDLAMLNNFASSHSAPLVPEPNCLLLFFSLAPLLRRRLKA
jgi:probable HAF family extracellular repeat protein